MSAVIKFSPPLPHANLSLNHVANTLGVAPSLAGVCTAPLNPHENPENKPNGLPPYRLHDFAGYSDKSIGVSQGSYIVPLGWAVHNIQCHVFPSTQIQIVQPAGGNGGWFTARLLPGNRLEITSNLSNPVQPDAFILLMAHGLDIDIKLTR